MSAYNSPALLLEALTARGVILHRNGDRLAFDAPRGAIGEFLPDIQRFRPALLELLERPAKAPETAPEAPLIAETPNLSPAYSTPAQIAENRARLDALDAATDGHAPEAIARATAEFNESFRRALESEGGAAAVHEIAVCVALLELGIDPENLK